MYFGMICWGVQLTKVGYAIYNNVVPNVGINNLCFVIIICVCFNAGCSTLHEL